MTITAAVHGVGTSQFGKQPELSLAQLAWPAIAEALADADNPRIDAVFVGTVISPNGTAQRVLRSAGIHGVPVVTVEAACASGAIAFGEAVHAVQTGRFGTVLALGLEQMSTAFDGAIHPNLDDTDGASGLALPGLYAMAASRYLATGRVTERQLAAVAVKNRGNAIHNERAHFAGRHTVDEVLGSRMIADPLTLLQCCPTSDGAAAAVVAPATGRAGAVRVRGVARGTGGLWDHRSDNVWGYDLIAATAQQAYAEADLADTADIDVAEMHDAFTISEVATSEALGLVPVGEGGAAAEDGRTALGGELPINPSGGLLSRGHPLGASGLAQLAEIVWQLRGQAGGRQVTGARLGLVETMGGGTAGLDGNACVVTVLEAG
ncbi:thiolase family protein [Mycolicibacterium thermoresistibile]